jgi:signal transduction histidine kinase
MAVWQSELVMPLVSRILREPFTRRARAELGYAIISVPLAIAGFAFAVVTLVAGAGLSLSVSGLLLGPPLVAASTFGARRLGSVSRATANRMLGERVLAPPPLRQEPGLIGWLRSALLDRPGWRARGYLVLKLPVAFLGLLVAAWFWLGGLIYLTYPAWWEIAHSIPIIDDGVRYPDPVTNPGPFGGVHVLTLPGSFLLIPFGAAALLVAPWATRAVVAADRALIRRLLGPESLVERMHDLEQTRAHAVDDSAASLRRIERDLHDGAQAQLVAIAMKLGLASEKLAGDERDPTDVARAAELVGAAQQAAVDALAELRDLARGIHPPVLDSGLDAALESLAARSAVPVQLVTHIPDRPSPTIETIAYFCAAELLANVAKHSGARHATLEAVHVPGLLRIRVTDDGTGGARLDAGTGLRGLADRVRTVDGQLDLSSPQGGPTVVTVELPSHA